MLDLIREPMAALVVWSLFLLPLAWLFGVAACADYKRRKRQNIDTSNRKAQDDSH